MPLLAVFKHFVIKVLGKLNRALRSARRAYTTFLTAKGYKQRVLATIAIYACSPVL
jgi:hypothetical protein